MPDQTSQPPPGPRRPGRTVLVAALAVLASGAVGVVAVRSGLVRGGDLQTLLFLMAVALLLVAVTGEDDAGRVGVGRRIALRLAALAAAAAVGASAAAMAGALGQGSAPAGRVTDMERRFQAVPVATIAGVLGSDVTTLMHALNAAGFTPVKPSDSPADIAARSGGEPRSVFAVLVTASGGDP